MYLPAKVLTSFAKGDETTVLTEDGEHHSLTSKDSQFCEECNPEALSSAIEDLVNISDLNEMSILHNLRIRFKEDKIYTNISSILISVNPFKLLPLYTPAVLDTYRSGSRGKAPHVFGIAVNAYNNMLSYQADQAVVCSGESGAGKSEATKLILQFLTDVSSRASQNTDKTVVAGGPSKSSQLEKQILSANPILEAFGNAKTLRNNNSSRFGKLITIEFDRNGTITGGGIINYLLEKSRIVSQTAGERNYHIFYQLLTAAETDPALTAELKLQGADIFNFTSQSGVTHVDGISDDKDFDDMKNAMDILHFSGEIQKEVLRVVAGVLHFGNIKFKVKKIDNAEDGSEVTNPDVLEHAASLWGCDPVDLEKFLTNKTIGTREAILTAYSQVQAQDARDAMVKRVYADLFQFLVNKINEELHSGGTGQRATFIGVLDIFGFEHFEVNSFEQLCINYCNEKLQFHFNEHIFRMEQTLYAEEGIVIPGSSFVDNQPCLDLLEAKATGIFSMLDEEIHVPRGSDEGVLQKILTKHAQHQNCLRPKPKDCKDALKNFGIQHYAGVVFYNVTNFLEKNKDQLHSDIIGVLSKSSSEMVRGFFPPEEEPAGGGRGKKSGRKTLGGQFKSQLHDLVATLNSTFPHFVRCMKSNDSKRGGLFTASRMQDQLRYAGLVEVCRIRKLGYPVRRPFDEFFKRYRCIELLAPDLDGLLKILTEKGILKEGEWAKGHTKMFMRTEQSGQLELAREIALVHVATVIQKSARCMIARRRYKSWLKILEDVEAAIQAREEEPLAKVIDLAFELPSGGGHLDVIKRAKALLARLREEKRVSQLLQSAIESCNIDALKSAIAVHAAVDPAFETPLAGQAATMLARLEAELAMRGTLVAAFKSRDKATLESAIQGCTAMAYECDELTQAQSMLVRIEQELGMIATLKEACDKEDLDEINKLLATCSEEGLATYYSDDIEKANKVKQVILARIAAEEEERRRREEEEERQRQALAAIEAKRKEQIEGVKAKLASAVASKNATDIRSVLDEAMQNGFNFDELEEARAMVDALQKKEDVKSQLSAAIKVLEVKAESGISTLDLQPLQHAIEVGEQHAKASGTFDELQDAQEMLEVFEKHANAKEALEQAFADKDRVKLRAAMDAAEDLDMQLEIMTRAREVMKELDATHGKLTTGPAGPSLNTGGQPYDAAEEARQMRQEIAKQARFDVKNFPNLRTADDFARGAVLNKTKIKDNFLSFQPMVIPKSLTDMNRENNKLALQIHKDLLGYMGDKQLPFPAMLAQDILRKGYEYKPIRDEIYLQIIKQLSNNPRPESVAKGWQVMCMCVGTFPPSPEFENFLLHYIIEKRDRGRGAVIDYARYCLRTLEAMLNSGDGTGFVPSVEEILAYKERPPILATIYLVDGNIITENLPLTPDLNVAKVLEMCSGWLDLKDSRINTLGMFVYDLGEQSDPRSGGSDPYAKAAYADLNRSPRPLRNEDYMGDTIVQKARQRRKFKFVLKRKLFLPKYNYRGDDPFFERMTYLQAEDEAIIQGNLEIGTVEEAQQLAAISMAVAFGEEMPDSVDGMLEANVDEFIPPNWRSQKPPSTWAEMILQFRDGLVHIDPDDLQDRFLQIVQANDAYGSHWFYVHKLEPASYAGIPNAIKLLPRDLLLAFNADGMHVYDFNRAKLLSFPYSDICRWGGSSSQFSLIMADETTNESYEFVLITSQAADMAAIILDHIRAIMAEQEMEG